MQECSDTIRIVKDSNGTYTVSIGSKSFDGVKAEELSRIIEDYYSDDGK